MFSILIFAELRIAANQEAAQRKLIRKALAPLRSDGSILGMSIWKSLENNGHYLALTELSKESNVSEFISAISKVIFDTGMKGLTQPPDMKPIRVAKSSGLMPHEAASGSIASYSVRIADPGAAELLMSDYEIVFEELAPIPGLRGWLYGQTLNLDEEVIGMAFWDTEEALESSIPATATYSIASFRKLASD